MSATTIFEPQFRLAPRTFVKPAPTPVSQSALLESRHLLQGQCEVLIRHGNEVYRLRHTRNDKLILTK